MSHYLRSRFFGRQLREGHDHPLHFAHIGCRESRQSFEFKLLGQFRVAQAIFRPIELGRGNEPERTSGQGGMVLPGKVFLGLELICTDLVSTSLDDPFAIPAKFRSLSIVIFPCISANACSLVSRVLLLNRCRNHCQCACNFGPSASIFSIGTHHRRGSNRFSPCAFAWLYHNLG